MAWIAVVITTDHDDADEAIRSVCNGLKRSGYDVLDYQIGDNHHTLNVNGIVEACEPEVNPFANSN